ncbi:QLQ domain-containing protein [Trichonephila clavipes]|nr:QLQ domain-containing protein [Trichonephila clavipes]
MNLALQSGRVWVWWMPGERFFNDCIVPTVKFGGGSTMGWGCFLWFGLGQLVPVIGNMSSEMYVDILDNAAIPTLWWKSPQSPSAKKFHQDLSNGMVILEVFDISPGYCTTGIYSRRTRCERRILCRYLASFARIHLEEETKIVGRAFMASFA